MENFKDVNFFRENLLDISNIDNPVFDFISSQGSRAFNQTKRETYDRVSKLEKLIAKATGELQKYAKGKSDLFNILLQRYEDDTLTGDIIRPFSKGYLDNRRKVYANLKKAASDEKGEAKHRVNEWIKNDNIVLNPYILYGEDEVEKEKYIKQLKEHLGESLYEYFKESLDRKLETYESLKSEQIRVLKNIHNIKTQEEFAKNQEASSAYAYWEALHSPYQYLEELKTGRSKLVRVYNELGEGYDIRVFSKGYEFVEIVPKRTAENGNDLGNYDSNFDIVLENENILEFYNFYIDTLEELKPLLPKGAQEAIRDGGLPEIGKTIFEVGSSDGMKNVPNSVLDNIIKMSRVDDLSNKDNSYIDPETGRTDRLFSFNLFRNNKKEWLNFLEIKKQNYIVDNDTFVLPRNFVEDARKEFNNMVAERKSKDLGKILKAYIGLSLNL